MSSSTAKKVGEWSWEENKAFEMALDKVVEETPNRWAVIAASYVPGKRPEEIAEHYEKLVYDVELIEAGYCDHVSSSTSQNNTSAAKDASTTTTISSKETGNGGRESGGSGGKKKKKKNS